MSILLPPTDDDLARWSTEADAATHGPWVVFRVEEVTTSPDAECCGSGPVCDVGDPYPRGCNRPAETMRFIAHSRTLVPLLIAEVRRLRAALP